MTWTQTLAKAYSETGRMPAFFFAHGSPALMLKEASMPGMEIWGANGTLAKFLASFGPFLMETYKPKAILVFSAHYEPEDDAIEVVSRSEELPIFYDYSGFPSELYKVKFRSNGSPAIASQVIESIRKAGLPVKQVLKRGLDHGVFVPFRVMFPSYTETSSNLFPIPVIQASLGLDLSPDANLRLGRAVADLRKQGILILSGGLTIHSFKEFHAFSKKDCPPAIKEFDRSIIKAVQHKGSVTEREEALVNLVRHPAFRRAHPREDHFVPIYIAAGAGLDEGDAEVIFDEHGSVSAAFGI